jgi:hypothetical protein
MKIINQSPQTASMSPAPAQTGKSAVVRVAPTERFSLGEIRDFEFDLEKIQFFHSVTGANVGLSKK